MYGTSKAAVPDATGEGRGATELHHIRSDRHPDTTILSTAQVVLPINAATAGQNRESRYVQGA